MKDIRIIQESSGPVEFDIYGTTQNEGIQLLQKLYVLLFCNPDDPYAYRNGGGRLDTLLVGANTPQVEAINSLLMLACDGALSGLDAEDRELIASFTGEYSYEGITLTLTLVNGEIIRGEITNG